MGHCPALTLWPVSRQASTCLLKGWLQTHPRNEEVGWGPATILILRDSRGPHSAGVGDGGQAGEGSG